MKFPHSSTGLRAFALMASLILFSGCSEAGDVTKGEIEQGEADILSEDVQAPEVDRGADGESAEEEKGPQRILVVLDTLGFTVVNEDGTAPGFNLDDRVSDEDDEETCGQSDYTSPEGVDGIDNQLAKLAPLFELFGIGAASALIQDAIEEGGLLILLQVDGVDDMNNDEDVNVMVRTGAGVPLLGTDGKLLSGQTFHLHPESPDSFAEKAWIEDGVLHAGPFDARLPIVVFGMNYELTLRATLLRAGWTYDGGLDEGIMGGGVTIEDLYAIGEVAAADDASVLKAIKSIVDGMGDLERDEDGECQMLSAGLSFSGVSAFYFPDEPGVEPPEVGD